MSEHIGVLESNLSGSGFNGLRAAKELGCRVTFFTAGMARYYAVPGSSRYFTDYVDQIVHCDTRSYDEVLAQVRTVERRHPFTAFMSMAEYEVVTAAQVAAALSVPTPQPEAVRIARNKVFMRRRCAERGVSMPRFRAVTTTEFAAKAAAEIGLPCVVKPADETSSAEVRRCTSVDEVVAHFELIRSKPENIRGQLRHPEILIEECVLGYEVSVEVLADGDRLHVLGVTDKSVGGSNRFVELGHLFPSLLPVSVRQECERVATDAIRAVGFDLGLAHVEVKCNANGAKLIEVNPRPAGDRITDLIDLALNIDCLRLVVGQYLGHPVGNALPAEPVRGAAIRFLTADAGLAEAVTGVEIAAAVPGVCDAVVSVRPGDRVGALLRNEDRVGHVLAVAESSYMAARIAEAAAHEIAVQTRG